LLASTPQLDTLWCAITLPVNPASGNTLGAIFILQLDLKLTDRQENAFDMAWIFLHMTQRNIPHRTLYLCRHGETDG